MTPILSHQEIARQIANYYKANPGSWTPNIRNCPITCFERLFPLQIRDPFTMALQKALGLEEIWGDNENFVLWNDDPARTEAEVIEVLEKVAQS